MGCDGTGGTGRRTVYFRLNKKTPETASPVSKNKNGGVNRSRTDLRDFADRCLTAWLSRLVYETEYTTFFQKIQSFFAFFEKKVDFSGLNGYISSAKQGEKLKLDSAQYRNTVLYLALIVLFFLLTVAFWQELSRTAGRAASDFCYPYLKAARSGFDCLSDQTLLVFSRRELASQLEKLRADNIRLASQAAAAADLLQENERLRRILKFAPSGDWEHIHCEMILRDPRFWHERITVDKGSIHGIESGAAAISITGEGIPVLAGVVTQVTRKTAVVTTIFNQELRISAVLPKSGTAGIIHTANMP